MTHDHGGTTPAHLLDLEGAVLAAYWTQALDDVRTAAPADPRRVLDLGAGSGVGTLGLARRFADAEIVALDADEAGLEHLRHRADEAGVSDRVRTVVADLDDIDGDGWPDLGALDVTWASMSLHHLTDPGRVLRALHTATRPGGLLAVAEFEAPLRVLPDDIGLGRPGLESRLHDTFGAEHAHDLPHLHDDWAPQLTTAGFDLVAERRFSIDLRPPHEPDVALYVRGMLERMRGGLGDRLDTQDRAALDELLDGDGPHALRHRADLHLRGTRTVTLARRT